MPQRLNPHPARGLSVFGPFDPAAGRLSGQVGASNSKTRGKCIAKGTPLRGTNFLSELKLRPTKKEACSLPSGRGLRVNRAARDSQPQARLLHQRIQAAVHPQYRPTSNCKGGMTMKTARNITRAISFAALLVMALAGASLPARSQGSQETAKPYLKMAPLDEYLMTDRSAEIAMARSAAPPSISAEAEVMVLGRHGYETAAKGTNGFVCLVERSWMSPFDFAQFWNPKMRGPICFNPPAVQSILPFTFKRTELVLAGSSRQQMLEKIKAANAKGYPALQPGAMSFMMSPQGYLNDQAGHWMPHLMFYIPLTDAKVWGADLTGSPVMANPQFNGNPEPITELMIPVATWSDGSPAPQEGQ